jgi:hypothetical protein
MLQYHSLVNVWIALSGSSGDAAHRFEIVWRISPCRVTATFIVRKS